MAEISLKHEKSGEGSRPLEFQAGLNRLLLRPAEKAMLGQKPQSICQGTVNSLHNSGLRSEGFTFRYKLRQSPRSFLTICHPERSEGPMHFGQQAAKRPSLKAPNGLPNPLCLKREFAVGNSSRHPKR